MGGAIGSPPQATAARPKRPASSVPKCHADAARNRGGLDGAEFAWGDELHPRNTVAANHWIGVFPWSYLGPHHRPGTSAIGSYLANGYGLVDMIGNVWEWTASLATSTGSNS